MNPMNPILPAVLIGGPPHSGKSVLAYRLSRALRQAGVAHYLLRAAPDGEGDWFLHNHDRATVRAIRQTHKRPFSPRFVSQTVAAITERAVPLLVDVGGRPQGEQFRIWRACTHAVLLYRTPSDLEEWLPRLEAHDLAVVAVLRSALNEPERIESLMPVLRGTIGGLDRGNPRLGAVFGALLERLRGILHYDEATLMHLHLRRAPFAPLTEDELAQGLLGWHAPGVPHWEPETALPPLAEFLARRGVEGGIALYGRGPLWLAAAVAVAAMPHPLALFDIRYGWLPLPEIGTRPSPRLQWHWEPCGEGIRLRASLTEALLTPNDLWLPADLPSAPLVILDGRLPRWAAGALARGLYARGATRLAVRDLHDGGAVVITSPHGEPPLGARLPCEV